MPKRTWKKQYLIRFLSLFGVSTAIFWLSLTSSPPVVEGPLIGWDKAQHALAYGVLALMAGRFFSLWALSRTAAWGFAVVYAIGFGGLLEILQAGVGTGRAGEWGDLFADAIGALGVSSISWWRQK
jgi:VanZ family protein